MIPIDDWKPVNADAELLKLCKKAIRQVVPDADVILYGSRARGDADEYSDYDILVLTSGSADIPVHEKMIESIYPLELDTGAVLTLAIYNRQQWDTPLYRAMPFHENVDRDGVIL
ncbi:MAG: nucleotidyltransferase domain-containing protein [Sedimentisphaerales bacterium]|nr:nucleotidyltransferase domain-containing protein [Sedimentisphaerales bacterium]